MALRLHADFRPLTSPLLPDVVFGSDNGDVDVSVRLADAEKEAAKDPIPVLAAKVEPTPEETDKFDKIAEISPRAAILELRNDLEDRVVSFVREQNLERYPTTMQGAIRQLRQTGKIDEVTSALLDDLRAVGNSAAHQVNRDFSKDEAHRFRSLYEVVAARLRAIESGQLKP